jgi:hypothetical protein
VQEPSLSSDGEGFFLAARRMLAFQERPYFTELIKNGIIVKVVSNGDKTSVSKRQKKVNPGTGDDGPEGEKRYSSTLSLTSALDRGEWSTPCPGIHCAVDCVGPRSGRVRKIWP